MSVVAALYNTARNLDTDYFASDIVPTGLPAWFRVTVAHSVGGTFRLILERDSVTYTLDLKDIAGATTLAADRLQIYEFPVHQTGGVASTDKETFNLQLSATGTVRKCVVEELHNYLGIG